MRTNVMTDFPFEHCTECELMEADMDIKKLYGDEGCILNEIIVFCRKGEACRRIWGKFEAKKKEEKKDAAE